MIAAHGASIKAPGRSAAGFSHHIGERPQYRVDLTFGRFQPVAGIDKEMGAAAFLAVRHLPFEDRFELRLVHVGPGENPLALNVRIGGDDDRGVHPALAAGLEQERDVEYGETVTAAGGRFAETALLLGDEAVHQLFQAGELAAVGEDCGGQYGKV